MDAYQIVAHFRRDDSGRLEGWCWSPDRPGERLTVDVLADAEIIVSVTADLFRRDLVSDGVGDGRHAFRVASTEYTLPPDAVLLTARERATGRIFGRTRLRDHAPPDPRLDALAGDLDAMRAQLATMRPKPDPTLRLRAGLTAVAARLAEREAGIVGAARRHAARLMRASRPRAVALPGAPAPSCSVMLWAGGLEATARTLAALAPALCDGRVELIIADSGLDPRTALLASDQSPAIVLHDRGGLPLADAAARAACLARGHHLVVLDTADADPSAAMLTELLRRLGDGVALAVADRALAAAELAGLAGVLNAEAAQSCDVAAPLSLLIAVERALFLRVGGLDAALAGSPVLTVADFCLKARLLGVAPFCFVGPISGEGPPLATPGPAASRAASLFAARWGRVTTAWAS